jgi:hypothetical protein
MVTVTDVFPNGGGVLLSSADGVQAEYGGPPNTLGEHPEDFHARVQLEDGSVLRVFIRRGKAARGVEPMVILEHWKSETQAGPELFRKWLKATTHTAISGNS